MIRMMDYPNKNISGQSATVAQKTKDIFPITSTTVKGTRGYRDQKFLLAIYYAMSHGLLRSPDLGDGEYKFKFVPREGSCQNPHEKSAKTIYISHVLRRGDEAGGKTISRIINGEQTDIGFFRGKAFPSSLEKMIKKLGGAPMISCCHPSVSLDSVLLDLELKIYDKRADPDSAALISPLYGLLLSERKGRDALVLRLCGNIPSDARRAMEVLSDIGDFAKMLEKNKADYHQSTNNSNPDLTVSKLVGAANIWPIPEKEARGVSPSLSESRKKELYAWSKSYCLDILPRVFGVELLEHTSFAQIDEFQEFVNLTRRTTGISANDRAKIDAIDKEFHTLIGLVVKADSDFKKMKYWVNEDAELWFEAACRQGGTRRQKVLQNLLELEKLAGQLDHNMLVQRLLLLILGNISVNLCRISRDEIAAWTDFSEKFKKELKSSGKKQFLKAIGRFCERASVERENIHRLEQETESEYRAYVDKKAKLTKSLLERMSKLDSISPKIGGLMRDVFSHVISHQGYKQGEGLSSNPADAYMSWQALAKAAGQNMPESAIRIYSMLSSDPRIVAETKLEMDRLLHYQTRGFDLESPLDYWANRGLTQLEIDVEYWLSEKLADGRIIDVLNLKLKNRHIEIKLRGKLPYDEEFVAENHILPPSEKTLEEEIYGKKFALLDLGISEGDGLGEIYSKLYSLATSEPELARSVGAKMASMDTSTAHFLSTFIGEEERFGVVSNKLGRSLPTSLSEVSENTFEQRLREVYPDLDQARQEVGRYMHIRAAAKIIQMMDEFMPQFSMKYANSLLDSRKA